MILKNHRGRRGPKTDAKATHVIRALQNGTYLGFKPPDEAAQGLASADARLSVMSFRGKSMKLFHAHETFTPIFLDYDIHLENQCILWDQVCTPVRVLASTAGGASWSPRRTLQKWSAFAVKSPENRVE